MGGTSKFKFPLPHRRSKQPIVEVQSISSPMTNKAQKLLGTAEINVDSASPTSSHSDRSKFWDTRSAVSGVSGISVTISESTATGTVTRTRSPLSTLQESTVTPSGRTKANGAAWDQESDIIPKGLGVNGSSAGRAQNLDTITDASSLRRRRSSSTIASYYDKTKLPLSISQQTSNSAMAKGLPNKAFELLSMDSPRPAPSPPTQDRRKPPKLDLTHLLPTAGSSSRNPLSRLAHKGSMVLGPDLMTRSPSVLSTSPAASPSDESKPEKRPRRKLTRESLRSLRSRSDKTNTVSAEEAETASIRKRATDAGTLYQLYEHYEHTSYRDTMTAHAPELEADIEQEGQVVESVPGPASRRDSRQSASSSSTRPRHHVTPASTAMSRHPYAAFSADSTFDTNSEMSVSAAKSSLASPPTDYAASVSSRHTRTSKASKWTDQSFTDFDPNATSVLSLSSDSEDDSSEPPRTAMSVPSIASMDSTSSPAESRRPSNTSISQESIRKQPKSKFRSSLNLQGHFLAIPEDAKSTPATAQPSINPRTTSLATALANASTTNVPQPNAASSTTSARPQSRLSQGSTSTSESHASQHSRPRPSGTGRQTPEVRHIAMFQSRAASAGHHHQESASAAEKPHDSSRKHKSPHKAQPTAPTGSSSLDTGTQNQHRSPVEYDGPVLTLNGNGGVEDERFMAVTRQEELLLAAMRARRALMRESYQIADLEFLDRAQVEGDKTASKKESLSSLKTVKANVPHPPPQSELPPLPSSASSSSNNDNAMAMLFPKPPSTKPSPTPQADDISEMDFGTMPPFNMTKSGPKSKRFEQTTAPPSSSTHYAGATKSSHSRAASAAAASGYLTHPKSARQKNSPRPDSDFMPMARPASAQAYHKTEIPSRGPSRNDWHPAEVEPVMERPESSSSSYQESEAEKQQPPSRKKAVRISAVGMQLPEIGQWGDDG